MASETALEADVPTNNAVTEPDTAKNVKTDKPEANGAGKVETGRPGESSIADDTAENTAATEPTPEAATATMKDTTTKLLESRDVYRDSEAYRLKAKRKAEHKKNVKYDASTLENSDDPQEIRKQVEFYFSDSNLPTDWHLVKLVGFSENRPVPIRDIHSFSRMRRFQPYEAVLAALKDSEFLEVTEDESVRRKEPLPEELWQGTVRESQKFLDDKTLDRSIYAKGFGEEKPSTQFDIEAFFAPYGPINAVRLRRTFTRIFKGSVFVEFVDEEARKKFMALEAKPKWQDEDLLWKSKRDYVEEKAADFVSGKRKSSRPSKDDWKARRDNDQKGGGGRGRGGGRGGGRGRGHGSRGGRGGFRNREREENAPERATKAPTVKASTTDDPFAKDRAAPEAESKKRTRDDTDGAEASEKATKTAKVEVGSDVSSKKDGADKPATVESTA